MRKFRFLKYLFFRKITVTVNLEKLSSNTIFGWYTFGRFHIAKFNYFNGRPNKVKERFEIFLTEHCAGDIKNKNIAGKYQKILVSVSPILY